MTQSTAPEVAASATSADASPSVAIVTLGCGRNEVDSDQLAGLFHREGLPVIDDPAAADVVLVNTCTFIAPAKQESIDTVLEACQLKDDGAARDLLAAARQWSMDALVEVHDDAELSRALGVRDQELHELRAHVHEPADDPARDRDTPASTAGAVREGRSRRK